MVIEKLIAVLSQKPEEFQLYRIKPNGDRKIVVLAESDWNMIIAALDAVDYNKEV